MIKEIEKISQRFNLGVEYKEVHNCDLINDFHIVAVHGSYAYGTESEGSDTDIRIVSGLDRCRALGAVADWETKVFNMTDTVAYSYKKYILMLQKGNPDAIAIVGNAPEDYIDLSEEGKELIENHTDLLGAESIYKSFSGYNNAQLKKLTGKLKRAEEGKEEPDLKKINKHCMHIVRSSLMGIEILKTGKVRTYREDDLPLLKAILSGYYMESGKITPEYYEFLEMIQSDFEYAYKNSVLPRKADPNKVADMIELFMKKDLKK